MKKKKKNYLLSNMIKLCDLTATKDKEGNVLKDEKGQIKSIHGYMSIQISIVPNPKSAGKWNEYSLYIGTTLWDLMGIHRFLGELYNQEKDKSEKKE